jgi:hypothetical protein
LRPSKSQTSTVGPRDGVSVITPGIDGTHRNRIELTWTHVDRSMGDVYRVRWMDIS